MAAVAKRLLTPQLLSNANATYYSAPENTRTILKKLTFTNNDGSSHDITVYLVPFGVSASDANMLLDAEAVAANSCYEATVGEGHVLEAGDTLQAFADAGNFVNIMASGVEIS
jgi:hypothetical protein